MSESAPERYSGVDEGTAALYDFLTEQIENRDVSTQNVPDKIHERAVDQVLERSQVPQGMFQGKTADQVELLLDQYSHDNAGLAQDYLEAVKQADMEVNGREEHDRKIDALIQNYLEDGIEDYDLVFRETEVEDQGYSQNQEADVKLTGRRTYDERPATDADFWAVDLDAERLLFQEVKSSDSYQDRKNRQLQNIREAVEAVNDELGTSYTVEKQPESKHNLETRYPVPNVYQGDVYVSEELDEEKEEFEEFESFVDEFLHKMEYQDLEPLTHATPDYSEAL